MMRQFYEARQPYLQVGTDYAINSKSVAAVSDLEQTDDGELSIAQNRLPVVSDFSMDAFTSISFTHHMEIIRKASSLDERLFYIRECAAGHWGKTALRARLKAPYGSETE